MATPSDLFSFEINGPARDLTGYGASKPNPKWPHGAKIAVSFVLNFEEGAESCILNGQCPPGCQYDHQSEFLLNDTGGMALANERHLNIESSYEYGSRAGFHRILGLFHKAGQYSGNNNGMIEYNNKNNRAIPLTVYSNSFALQLNPEIGHLMVNAGWELATHGYRWIDYMKVTYPVEKKHVQKCVDEQEEIIGYPPVGFYVGRPSKSSRGIQMRTISNDPDSNVVKNGKNNENGTKGGLFHGFMYDNDVYNDDLPYWYRADQIVEKELEERGENGELPSWARPMLVLPYTLELNDRKFVGAGGAGWSNGDDFFESIKSAILQLLHEIDDNDVENGMGVPKMLSIGLHCRLSGRPARAYAIKKILDWIVEFNANYTASNTSNTTDTIPNDHVNHYYPIWVCRRVDIARHWYANFYPVDSKVPNPIDTIDVLPKDFDQYADEFKMKLNKDKQ